MKGFDVRRQGDAVLLQHLFERKTGQTIKAFEGNAVTFVADGVVVFQANGAIEFFFMLIHFREKIFPEVGAVFFFTLVEEMRMDAIHKIGRNVGRECES